MKIIESSDLFETLKDKRLLFDTNAVIDAFNFPAEFAKFRNRLIDNNTAILTIDLVKVEFLKGASTEERYMKKEKFMDEFFGAYLFTSEEVIRNMYDLIQQYGADGAALSVTDLMLGGLLKEYQDNLFLLTKDTTDFSTTIFTLAAYMNLFHTKSIQSYGVYQYTDKNAS